MKGKQTWVVGLPVSAMAALNAPVVSTELSTIRLHDLSKALAINLGPEQ